MKHVVVVGGGQAGFSVVSRLRDLGFDGQVTLISQEPELPYQRPPLSKKYLLGEMERSRLYFRPAAYFAEKEINLRLGVSCRRIDAESRTVALNGELLSYDELVLVTGSVPRRIPAAIGGDLGGVHTVRSVADIDALKPELADSSRVLVIGGGYIGLEAASAASSLCEKVVVAEAEDRILKRVAAADTSRFVCNVHKRHGVEILEGAKIERLRGDGTVSSAIMSDGEESSFDVVIVGVGIAPATDLAESAGLRIENGIWTDSKCRTSAPNVWAAGDCTSFPWKGRRIRLESVQNAIDQAECVAENILGADKNYSPTPWFWSDQYDIKLQIAGLNTGYSQVVARKGNNEDAVSFWYFDAKQDFLAVDALNDPRSYMVGKRLLEAGKQVSPSLVADVEINLKSLLK